MAPGMGEKYKVYMPSNEQRTFQPKEPKNNRKKN